MTDGRLEVTEERARFSLWPAGTQGSGARTAEGDGADRDGGMLAGAGHSRQGMSLSAARLFAEQAHDGELDSSGEPYIDHVARVAASAPLIARPVAWLHDVTEHSEIDESVLVDAGASQDECLALRLLRHHAGEPSDELYLQHVRVIALSRGLPGEIARGVKRADLLDHVSHRAAHSDAWTPPHGAALAVMMMVSTASE